MPKTPESRLAQPGETCSCGDPAAVVFVTEEFGDVGYCGVPKPPAPVAGGAEEPEDGGAEEPGEPEDGRSAEHLARVEEYPEPRWAPLVQGVRAMSGRPSLRALLDAGGDATTVADCQSLVDTAVMALTSTRAFNAARAVEYRQGAELHEDPALALRLIDSLPEPARAAAQAHLDAVRRPHPISVEVPDADDWSCENCGDPHDFGDGVVAVLIGGSRDGSSPLTFCAGCVTIAAAVAEDFSS